MASNGFPAPSSSPCALTRRCKPTSGVSVLISSGRRRYFRLVPRSCPQPFAVEQPLVLQHLLVVRRLWPLVVLIGGCATWSSVPEADLSDGSTFATAALRITLSDGGQISVREGRVVGDSLIGIADGEQVAFALGDISAVEQAPAPMSAVGATAAGAAVFVSVLAVIVFISLTNMKPYG